MRSRPVTSRPAPSRAPEPTPEPAAETGHEFLSPRPVHPMAVLRAQVESIRTLVNSLAGNVTPQQLQEVVGVQCDAAVALCDSIGPMMRPPQHSSAPRTQRRAFDTFDGPVLEHEVREDSGASAPHPPPTIDVDQGGDITTRREG